MATLNLDFHLPDDNDLYSDGDIEQELLRLSQNPEYDWFKDGRWPVVYHLSHLRQNILNWFPFKENSSILEIGAGCGALTGMLCERASRVVAVELTKRRAEVNFYRHQHYENLEIVVCDIQHIPEPWKFDYVVVNGVMEYAAYMFQGDNPYKDFLKLVKSHLAPDGKLLLSIENRLGLKYFSGAREDHTGEFFSGINGYCDGENVRTFSKVELDELVQQSGLHVIKYYYPYPDYKFPVDIFTDETVNTIFPSSPDFPLDLTRAKLFEEREVYKSFMKLGLMGNFSNSFLVEIALHSNMPAADVSYAKISANRKKTYQIATVVNKDRSQVLKKELTLEARNHVNQMAKYSGYSYAKNGRVYNAACSLLEQGISYPFITKPTLKDVLVTAYKNNDLNSFNSAIKDFRDALFEDYPKEHLDRENVEILGDVRCDQALRWAAQANLDMIAGNIFIDGDKYEVIDFEWQFPYKLPLEFVLWRMLIQMVDEYGMHHFLTKQKVYDLLDINAETEQCFVVWENHFAGEFVGIKPLFQLSQDVIPINIGTAIINSLKENRFISSLFFDLGSGYTEEYVESNNTMRYSDYFTVTFRQETLKQAKALRWDPLEGNACRIKIKSVETDGVVTGVQPLNAVESMDGNNYTFHTYDPQIEIEGDFTKASYIKVDFYCEILDWAEGYAKQEQKLYSTRSQLERQSAVINKLQNETLELKDSIADLKQQFQIITSAKEHVEKVLTDQVNSLQAHLQEVTDQLTEARAKWMGTQDKLDYTTDQLHKIIDYSRNNRFKAAGKILLHGDVTRGLLDE